MRHGVHLTTINPVLAKLFPRPRFEEDADAEAGRGVDIIDWI